MSKKPKSILNDPSHAVEEFVLGLCWQYPHRLMKLQNHNVLLLRSPEGSAVSDSNNESRRRRQVQLLSGGGSGHEPSHAGWIGAGMLRGAICGGMFASPSVASILAAIRAAAVTTTTTSSTPATPTTSTATNPVLLIVKNYTGDRLNFGLACERANNEGLECDMVVIADDVALPRTKGITGARGVAGTVLLHKIAGAAAAAAAQPNGSKTLSELKDLIQHTAACLGTLGMALDSVTVPGAATVNDRLHDDTIMEIGLGIHGEAGLRQSKLLTSKEMAREMIQTIQTYGRVVNDKEQQHDVVTTVPMFQAGDELAMLINNLGGTSNFELSILAKDCVETAEAMGAKVSRVYVGSYMTSFNMHGASLTILNLTAAPRGVAECLDAATDAPAWAPCEVWKPSHATESRPSLTEWDVSGMSKDVQGAPALQLPPLAMENFGSSSRKLVQAAAHALMEQEELLTKYDTIVGDGDCGITMKRGATQVLSVVQQDSIVTDHPVTLFAALADAVSASMGGTSGVLLELMFRKMSSTLARCSSDTTTPIGAAELALAFEAGVNAVSLYGGAKVGARTMLDALVPAAASLVQGSKTSSGGENMLQLAAEQARQGADLTATMAHASAGRSNYLSEETLAGTPDPGAVAVAIVLEAMAKI